jgi:TolB-like protein
MSATKYKYIGWLLLMLLPAVAVPAERKTEAVAVLPLVNLTSTAAVEGSLTDYVTSALREQTAFSVIHERQVTDCLDYYEEFRRPMPPPEKALRLARRLGADVVVYGSVDEYSGYYPFRLCLSVSVVRVADWQLMFESKAAYDADMLLSGSRRVLRTSQEFNRYACARFVKEVFNPLAMEGEKKKSRPFWRRYF